MRLAPTAALSLVLPLAGWTAATAAAPGWTESVRSSIAAAEYQISPRAGELQAPNRAHGFRTWFDASGIRVVPRLAEDPAFEWTLTWTGYGAAGAVEPVPPAELVVRGNRADYRRGPHLEWYENLPEGLKQGFVLAPPASGGTVHLDFALGGTLRPLLAEDGLAIRFVRPSGAGAIHFAGLHVVDAGGREVPARFEAIAGGIRIVLEAADAAWPVTVDPLATSPAWYVESNQAGARMGFSAATAGDVNGDGYEDVIVGAYLYDNGEADEGRAWLFPGSASGPAFTTMWMQEGNQAGAGYGYQVGTAGDVNGDGYSDVFVAAYLYDGVGTDAGRVLVYHGSSSGPSSSPAWIRDGGQTAAWFGFSTATAGDVNGDGYSDLVVGALFHDTPAAEAGRAFVYHGSASGLSGSANWTTDGDQVGARHGASVAMAGDVNGDGYSDVIVGADFRDNGGIVDAGRVSVYHGSATGLALSAAWVREGDQASSNFGHSVATAGDVNGDGYSDVIVGAYTYDLGQADEGAAWVWLGSATGLSATHAWRGEGNQAGANFGYPVAPAGDVHGDGYADVLVGASGYDNGEVDEGRAYLFMGNASGLYAQAGWTSEGEQAGANFGVCVAPAGDVNGDGYSDVIVGAWLLDNGQADEGRASVYLGGPEGLPFAPGWSTRGQQAGARFGWSVASAGDVDGDGYADVIVGAYTFDEGQEDEGKTFVFHGSPSGLSAVPAWTAQGDRPFGSFGSSVASAGDVNGDGYGDVVVGHPGYESGQSLEGRALVFLGSPAGLSTVAAWVEEGDEVGARFGSSVASAGDVNGDGFADLAVGAPYAGDQLGASYVYHGSGSGPASSASWSVIGDQTSAQWGYGVASAGDVNRDGYADLAVVARLGGLSASGSVAVFHGSAGGLGPVPAWNGFGADCCEATVNSAASAGDVNGDGYSDLILGSPGADTVFAEDGIARVYHGSPSGLMPTPARELAGIGTFREQFGESVAGAGDVNGDGYADVVVGGPGYSTASDAGIGSVYVWLGSPSGISGSQPWMGLGREPAARLGMSVAGAGDVNGDGYADLIAGAPYESFDAGLAEQGWAHVYYGSSGPLPSLRPRQLRVSSSVPIARSGASDDSQAFRLAMEGRVPFGPVPLRLEIEVKPLDTAFNGAGLQRSAWIAPSSAPLAIDQVVGGLTPDTPYHWRMRLAMRPTMSPFQQRSRWFRIPEGGWNEATLRTATLSLASGRVPATGTPLRVDKSGSEVSLSWGTSCVASDTDYAIYEGQLRSFASHQPRTCSTGGATSATFTPATGDRYFLVAPRNAQSEGSLGSRSDGTERPAGAPVCVPRQLASCPGP